MGQSIIYSERQQAIKDCIEAVEAEEELLGPMPGHLKEMALADPETSARAVVRATKASIVRQLTKLMVPASVYPYFLVTYEWRSRGRHSSQKWLRDNEVIQGCPAVWWAKYLKQAKSYEEAQEEQFRTSGRAADEPQRVEYRFLYATPISKEGAKALGE